MASINTSFPNAVLTWGRDYAEVQLPITIGLYLQLKKISNQSIILKHFNTIGGYHGANNHPADFWILLEEGDYEVTVAAVHKTRLPTQVFCMRHDTPDTNSSSSALNYIELVAGQQVKFPITISAYNPNGTQWFKLNAISFFENRVTHQFQNKNPIQPPYPPTSDNGQLTEKQYYEQDVCPIVVTNELIQFQNPNVPILPQNPATGYTTSRFSLPNTPTIEILNPNVNGGNSQFVNNPYYQNIENQPSSPAILSPSSQPLGVAINGTVGDATAAIVVFRNDVEITTIAATPSYGTSGTWSYTPTTSSTYKFKARKNNVDSVFSNAVVVTNSCNLVNNQIMATWQVNGNQFIAKTFNNGVSYHLLKVVQLTPLRFEKRGKNMLLRSDMTSTGSWRLADIYNCFEGNDTDIGGLAFDTSFVIPAGFKKVGDIYEQITTVKPSAPVPDTTTGTVGVSSVGSCNQAGTVIIFRDGVQVGTVLTSGQTNIYGFNPTQAGIYTLKNTNDNGTSDASVEIIVKVATVITTRKFRAKNVNYCDISPENIQCGFSTTTAADVEVWEDGIILRTDLLLAPNLKGFIRDKTNHARVFGREI